MPPAPNPLQNKDEITPWGKLSLDEKNKIFAEINPNTDIQGMLNAKGITGISPAQLLFEYKIELSIEKHKKEQANPPEQTKTHNIHFLPEVHVPESHPFKPKTLTPEMEANIHYKEHLEEVKKQKKKHWDENKEKIIQKKQKQLRRLLTSEEVRQLKENPESDFTKETAEQKYRSKWGKEAKDFDKKERTNTSAGSYEKDFFGKQYKQAALEHAEIEVKNRLEKKYKKGKISEAEYRAEANKIYQKHQKNFAKDFIRDHKEKAEHYLQNRTDPILNNAWEEMKPGRAKKYYEKQKAAAKTALPKTDHPSLFDQQSHLSSIGHGTYPPQNNEQPTKPKFDHPSEFPDEDKEQPQASYPRMPKDIEQGQKEMVENYMNQMNTESFSPMEQFPEAINPLETNAMEGLGGIAPEAMETGEILGAEAAAAPVAAETIAASAPIWANPIFWIVFFIILLIIIIFIFFIMNNQLNGQNAQNQNTPVPGLTITVSQPSPSIPNLGTADFTVNVTCNPSCKAAGDIIIYDKQFPAGTSLNPDKTKTTGTYTTTQYPISWLLKDNTPTTDPNGADSYTFTFSLNTTSQINNVKIATTIYGDVVAGTAGGGADFGDSCGTTYNLTNTSPDYTKFYPKYAPANFGDAKCEFTQQNLAKTKNDAYTYLQSLGISSTDLSIWNDVVIPCESGWDPNAYASQADIGTPDPGGAWGLVQMGQGRNGPNDNGKTAWRQQLSNAINYNKGIGGSWRYWACAQAYWR